MNEEELLRQLKHNLVIFAKDYRRIFKEYKDQHLSWSYKTAIGLARISGQAASKTVRKYGLSERYWFVHGMYNLIKSDPYRKLVEQKKDELKSLINHGATDAAIGAELGMTVSRVKYWIKEWNLGRRKHIIATGRFR